MSYYTDTERLAWLASGHSVTHRSVSGTQTVRGYAEDADAEWFEIDGGKWVGFDLRQDIDTAMSAEES